MSNYTIGIIRGSGIILRHQTEQYECLKEIFKPSNTYILSEQNIRPESNLSYEYLKYFGNMSPIQCICLDKSNIDIFLNRTMKKFDMIMEQGEHFPLSLLINKYAKKHGVITVDSHQANDYYDNYFDKHSIFLKRMKDYLYFFYQLRYKKMRDLWRVVYKYDKNLFLFLTKNFKKAGFRFYKDLPPQYRFDKCFVYGNYYKKIYGLMGYKDQDIIVSGSYDLTKYERLRHQTKPYISSRPYVIYCDSQLIQRYGFVQAFNNFANCMIKKGYDFFFNPHPNLPDDFIHSLDSRIKVIPKRSINNYIDNADFVFMHISNMINIMAYVQKKFCFLYWPGIQESNWAFKLQQKYARVLEVPNIDLTDYEKLSHILNSYTIDHQKYNNFLMENCGTSEIHRKGTDTIIVENLKQLLNERLNSGKEI